jgi:tetratricopeptide (TPR) repeat protein
VKPSPSRQTLERLVAFLPELEEVEELRLAMVGASVPDPVTEWDSARDFTTIDKRVVEFGRLEQVVSEAEEAVHRNVRSLYAGIGPLLRALGEERHEDAARELVSLGERQEASGRYVNARECFRSALSVAMPLSDRAVQILALRRLGRVTLALGDFADALLHYRRSRDLARDAGDTQGRVVAETGCGNVLAVQGCWEEAEVRYREALRLALEDENRDALQVERGHLFNNLGMVATRQRRLGEAEAWFERALDVWSHRDSPTDLAICYHSLALLREAQGRLEDAQAMYGRARELPVPHAILATVTIDLAESFVETGMVPEALRLGREAEEHAIAARSPYYLAHMYRGLGKISTAAGDEDGFTFFEKSLEIARAKGYRLLEGEALIDYSLHRGRGGQGEEARAMLEQAAAIFRDLGAVHEQERAERLLARADAAGPAA